MDRDIDADTIAARWTLYEDWKTGAIASPAKALWRIDFLDLWSKPGETAETDNGWREFVRSLLRLDGSEKAARASEIFAPTPQPPHLFTPPRAQIRSLERYSVEEPND